MEKSLRARFLIMVFEALTILAEMPPASFSLVRETKTALVMTLFRI